MRVSGFFACCLARGRRPLRRTMRRVQTAASRPTNAEKEGERKAEKSMHLQINKRENKRKSVLQIQKSMHKEPGRAGGQRPAAWPGGNDKKYAPKSAGETCCRVVQTAASRPTKPQKKKQKKASAGQTPGLAARRGSGGRCVVAASASLGAA